MRRRRFGLDSGHGAGAHHHLLDHAKNIFLAGKRHLQVQLREFRLAVCTQILIAKAFDDLEVPIEPADRIAKDLRRRQRKMPR
jgi:hypothetical protein